MLWSIAALFSSSPDTGDFTVGTGDFVDACGFDDELCCSIQHRLLIYMIVYILPMLYFFTMLPVLTIVFFIWKYTFIFVFPFNHLFPAMKNACCVHYWYVDNSGRLSTPSVHITETSSTYRYQRIGYIRCVLLCCARIYHNYCMLAMTGESGNPINATLIFLRNLIL